MRRTDAQASGCISTLRRPGPSIRERTIVVEQAVSLGEMKETKTRRMRSVRLIAPLAVDLALWRDTSPRPDDDDLVFPRVDGAPWTDFDYKNWRRWAFASAAATAGVRKARPYDLRHAFVSLLLTEGRSVLDVAGQAGHAPSLSFDTYGHLVADLDDLERRPAEQLIWDAREARVSWVCHDATENDESPALAGLSRGAL
jgi:integrase